MDTSTMTKHDSRQPGDFVLKISDDDPDVAYLQLPTCPGGTFKMSRSVRLVDLLGKYEGPDVIFDFGEKGVLVGIEILA
jgi:hypothetical protein